MTFTPQPWKVMTHYGKERLVNDETGKTFSVVLPDPGSFPEDIICEVWGQEHDDEANARLISAAPDLYQAAILLEAAEVQHANCKECDGEGVPELCSDCFPLFDDARVKRRQAIRKAEGPDQTI